MLWWRDLLGFVADILSVLTAAVAVYAWWQIREVTSKYQALVRIPEHVSELKEAASEIVKVAPLAKSNSDAVLAGFSAAQGKLTSVKGRIGGRYSFGSRRRELVLEVIEVRDALKRYQVKGAVVDRATAMDMYRRISTVTKRVEDYVEDMKVGELS